MTKSDETSTLALYGIVFIKISVGIGINNQPTSELSCSPRQSAHALQLHQICVPQSPQLQTIPQSVYDVSVCVIISRFTKTFPTALGLHNLSANTVTAR